MSSHTVTAGTGLGILMAYEVSGRVVSDSPSCRYALSDASVALFDDKGVLLDDTRTDNTGHFDVTVRNPDAADAMTAALDNNDPTVQVDLVVQARDGNEQRLHLRLPRPVHGKEFLVRFSPRPSCDPDFK